MLIFSVCIMSRKHSFLLQHDVFAKQSVNILEYKSEKSQMYVHILTSVSFMLCMSELWPLYHIFHCYVLLAQKSILKESKVMYSTIHCVKLHVAENLKSINQQMLQTGPMQHWSGPLDPTLTIPHFRSPTKQHLTKLFSYPTPVSTVSQ